MSKKERQQFAIIGLGRFGLAVAHTLSELGKEVLAIDMNEEKVNLASAFVTHTIVGDAGDERLLKSIGIKNFDVVIICMGENMQSSILCTMICKQEGVKYIVSKAQSKIHKKVLEKIGADLIVFPEEEIGIKIAHRLVNPDIASLVELSEYFKIVEIKAPEPWVNKKLSDTDIRKKYSSSVIIIKRIDGSISVSPGGEEFIKDSDTLVIAGSSDDISRLVEHFSI